MHRKPPSYRCSPAQGCPAYRSSIVPPDESPPKVILCLSGGEEGFKPAGVDVSGRRKDAECAQTKSSAPNVGCGYCPNPKMMLASCCRYFEEKGAQVKIINCEWFPSASVVRWKRGGGGSFSRVFSHLQELWLHTGGGEKLGLRAAPYKSEARPRLYSSLISPTSI
jgi:hypothetical protein